MSLQFKTSLRNEWLDQIETDLGTSPILTIRTGAPPATCATANSGTVLATLTLPSDWMSGASLGQKAKSGTWEDVSADAAGTAGHFRIHDSGLANCYVQGTCTATGGGGDMTLDNAVLAVGQDVVVSTFTITAPGA